MVLRGGFLVVAQKLQEAAAKMSHDDIQTRLRDALSDTFRGTGSWGYLVTVFGDEKAGYVIYSSDSDLRKADYTCSANGATIETAKSVSVVPLTTYEIEAGEVVATEAGARNSKRDLSQLQAIHDATATLGAACFKAKESSAGGSQNRDTFCKAKSLQEAWNSLGGEPAIESLRKFGKAIFELSLSERSRRESLALLFEECTGNSSGHFDGTNASGQRDNQSNRGNGAGSDSNSREAALSGSNVSRADSQKHSIVLSEAVAFPVDIQIREAFKPSYQIKLIAPGKGSSAIYPAEVLKRDGPKVFKAGTPMRIDHPTRAEEAARPEGSVKDWGAVLESDAFWSDDHAQGPGLYSRVKPFSDFAGLIEEKGPFAGVSIRANGEAVMESGRVKMQDGLPVLAALTSAEGVDMVTRAGAGGMFLSESARTDNSQEGQVEMTEAEIKKLIDDGIAAGTSSLKERALKGDAIVVASRVLRGVSLSEAQKQFVADNAMRGDLPLKEGALDEKKFGELVIAEAQRYGATLGNGARVIGLGVAVTEAANPADEDDDEDETEQIRGGKKRRIREAKPDADAELMTLIESDLGMSKSAALRAAKGRAA